MFPNFESFSVEHLSVAGFLALSALFLFGVRKLERRIAGDVAAELKARGIERRAAPDPDPDEDDHDFADEAPREGLRRYREKSGFK